MMKDDKAPGGFFEEPPPAVICESMQCWTLGMTVFDRFAAGRPPQGQ